jgi:hypothetical protein
MINHASEVNANLVMEWFDWPDEELSSTKYFNANAGTGNLSGTPSKMRDLPPSGYRFVHFL